MVGNSAAQSVCTAKELGKEYLRAFQAKEKQAIFAILADFALEVPLNISGTNHTAGRGWRLLTPTTTSRSKSSRIVYTEFVITPGRDADIAFAEGLVP